MKLVVVRVFSCKHPLIQPTARSCRGLSWPRSFGMGFRVLAAAYLGGESVCIQLFRERLSENMCTRQPRKIIWDMIDTLFLTTVAVEPTFVTFL